jgi:hypothetical protein
MGPSTGSHMGYSLFGLWMIDNPDIEKAVNRAIDKKQGDAMINVNWNETTSWFIIISTHTVEVNGEVIKFEKPEEDNEKK